MPNTRKRLQPQGVSLDIDVTQLPKTHFFVAEYIDDNKMYPTDSGIVLPDIINLLGHPSDLVTLLMNDALLRTKSDSISINVDATDGAIKLNVLIPSTDYRHYKSVDEIDKEKNLVGSAELTIPAGEKWAISINNVAGSYSFSHKVIDMFTSNDDSSEG